MFGDNLETVDDLIEALEQHRGKKLRAAVQPTYPMGASVVGVAVKQAAPSYDLESDPEDDFIEPDENDGAVYIVISDHEDYSANKRMWERGW